MTPIVKNGFLGDEIKTVVSDIRSVHSDLYNLCDDLNKLCHATLFKFDAHSEEPQELLVVTLFLRIKSSFQAVVILTERGMIPQAKVVLRSILETLFTQCALVKKPELCDRYMLADQIRRLKQINKFKLMKIGLPKEANESDLFKLQKELKEDIEKKQIKKLSVEEWARAAEQHDIYLSAYTVLCDPVHTSVKELERYLVLEDDEIKELKWGPDTNDIEIVLSANIEFMLVSLKATCDLFKINEEKDINDLHGKLKELIEARRKSEKNI